MLKGKGIYNQQHNETCNSCKGTGMIRTELTICMTCLKRGCSNCGGTGFAQHLWSDCPNCIGTGTNNLQLINSVIGKK